MEIRRKLGVDSVLADVACSRPSLSGHGEDSVRALLAVRRNLGEDSLVA